MAEKYTHSKINKDNSSTYQTQIMALSPVRRVQQKPPSPISSLQSISLSDRCCLSSLAPFCLILTGWSFCMPSYPPVRRLKKICLPSNQQSFLLSQPPAHPPALLFSLMSATSPFHGETFLPFMVRRTQSGERLLISKLVYLLFSPSILPSIHPSVWTRLRTNCRNDQGSQTLEQYALLLSAGQVLSI